MIIVAPSLNEQQKIADCLSSLDALIAAYTEKLDALKTQKKGLMQQLFPRFGDCTGERHRATQHANAKADIVWLRKLNTNPYWEKI